MASEDLDKKDNGVTATPPERGGNFNYILLLLFSLVAACYGFVFLDYAKSGCWVLVIGTNPNPGCGPGTPMSAPHPGVVAYASASFAASGGLLVLGAVACFTLISSPQHSARLAQGI